MGSRCELCSLQPPGALSCVVQTCGVSELAWPRVELRDTTGLKIALGLAVLAKGTLKPHFSSLPEEKCLIACWSNRPQAEAGDNPKAGSAAVWDLLPPQEHPMPPGAHPVQRHVLGRPKDTGRETPFGAEVRGRGPPAATLSAGLCLGTGWEHVHAAWPRVLCALLHALSSLPQPRRCLQCFHNCSSEAINI